MSGDWSTRWRKNHVGKAAKDIDIDDNAFKPVEAIIRSMTPAERENPDLINQSRRTRIAKGLGTNIAEVTKLMKQFDGMRKMMKQFSNPLAAAKMMRGMPKIPFGKVGSTNQEIGSEIFCSH